MNADQLLAAIMLAEDDEFEATLNAAFPLETLPEQVCMRCGRENRDHKYGSLCPTEEFGLFKRNGEAA